MDLKWFALLEDIPRATVCGNERRSKVLIMVLGYTTYV